MTLTGYCPRCGAQRSDMGRIAQLRAGLAHRRVALRLRLRPVPSSLPRLSPTAPFQQPGGAVDCPDGPHPNFVRKVSAVYTEGVGRTSMAGGTYSWASTVSGDSIGAVSMSGVSQTALSASLAPPPEPVYESPWTGGWFLLMVLCLGFWVLCWIPIGAIIIYGG